MNRISHWTDVQLVGATGGKWRGPALERSVDSVETDTRKLTPGALFVALRGDRFDGHDYLDAARQAGAVAALVDRSDDSVALPQLVVDDTLAGLQRLGRAVWQEATDAGLHSVALTGSNGKTTTKEFLAALFRSLGPTHATPGNFNNHIGVPLTLCALPDGAAFAVVEMGANDFGDIRELVEICPAKQRVLVSIGAAHLENLGDLDGVRRVKSEIFEVTSPGDIAVVPTAHLAGLHLEPLAGELVLVGEGGEIPYEVTPHRGGSTVVLKLEGGDIAFQIPYPGRHNAENFALAAATVVAGGFELDVAAAQVQIDRIVLPGGRLRRVELGELVIIDDAYNANPTSVVASYDAFLEIAERELSVPERERAVVIGEMFELGEEAARLHAETARAVAQRGGSARYVWVGPYAEEMRRAAEEFGESIAAQTPEEAARHLPRRGIVLLKASRGQRLEEIIDLIESS